MDLRVGPVGKDEHEAEVGFFGLVPCGQQHAQRLRVDEAGVAEVDRDSGAVVEQLRAALRVERRRVATKPTAASVERRLEQKRRRSRTKRLRQDTQE